MNFEPRKLSPAWQAAIERQKDRDWVESQAVAAKAQAAAVVARTQQEQRAVAEEDRIGRALVCRAILRGQLSADAAQVQARAPRVEIDALPREIVWMPAGTNSLTATVVSGGKFEGEILCDEIGAAAVNASAAEMMAAGIKLWIDSNHDDGASAAWVNGFRWDPLRGIIAHVDWTPFGARLLRERQFTRFSPAFTVNKTTKRVAGLLFARAVGGLVNAPGFGRQMPNLLAGLDAAELVRDTLAASGRYLRGQSEILERLAAGARPAAVAAAIATLQ